MVATNHDLIDIPGGATDLKIDGTAVLQENVKLTVFEPHMHAAGVRFCLEAIYGTTTETPNCSGYDHSWVLAYAYKDDVAPLLPKGTVLHITGYFDNTSANYNVPDARNWQGSGNRSVTNMFIDLGIRVTMTDEQFEEEMEKRRKNLNLGPNDHVIGCPLCAAPLVWPIADSAESSD